MWKLTFFLQIYKYSFIISKNSHPYVRITYILLAKNNNQLIK